MRPTARPPRRTLAVILPLLAGPALAADIVLTPPSAGGVAITNASGNATHLRVADDGTVLLPAIAAVPGTATGLCLEIATGRVGTCSVGSITSIVAGTGLTGGTITATGTIALATGGVGTAQLADAAITGAKLADGTITGVKLADGTVTKDKLSGNGCISGQLLKWNGASWTCATDQYNSGTVTSLTALSPLTGGTITTSGTIGLGTVPVANGGTGVTTIAANGVVVGQGTSAVTAIAGSAGQLLAGTAGAPQWTSSPSISGNLTLPDSTASLGNIMKAGIRFLHNGGSPTNVFLGYNSGSYGATSGANVGLGTQSLMNLAGGGNNTAVGTGALYYLTTGNSNVAVGMNAGNGNPTGSNNVYIGTGAGPLAAEDNTIRIGSDQTRIFLAGINSTTFGTTMLATSEGQLGVLSSSARYKDDIADMGEASGGLMDLRPVTFTYKADAKPVKTMQYGLVAEEVEKVYPGLVVYREDGRPESVAYHFLAPMLLNEVQKQQRTIDAQRRELDELRAEMKAIRHAIGLAR